MIFNRFILTHSHSYSIRVIDHFKVKMAGYWPIFLFFFFFLCVLWTAANERDLYPLILTFNLTFQLNNITYMECGGHWVRINMLRVFWAPDITWQIGKKNSWFNRFTLLMGKRQKHWLKLIRKLHKLPIFFLGGVKVGNPKRVKWTCYAQSASQESLHLAHGRCQLRNT